MTDVEFARKGLSNNLAGIELGKLAIQKGDSDLKQFGQKMVKDHGELNDQLKPLAEEVGVASNGQLSAEDQAMITMLEGKSGKQFNDAYIQAVVTDHRKDMLDFGNEARIGKDPALKGAAEDGAQVVTEHLHMIEKIARTSHVAVPDSMSQ